MKKLVLLLSLVYPAILPAGDIIINNCQETQAALKWVHVTFYGQEIGDVADDSAVTFLGTLEPWQALQAKVTRQTETTRDGEEMAVIFIYYPVKQ